MHIKNLIEKIEDYIPEVSLLQLKNRINGFLNDLSIKAYLIEEYFSIKDHITLTADDSPTPFYDGSTLFIDKYIAPGASQHIKDLGFAAAQYNLIYYTDVINPPIPRDETNVEIDGQSIILSPVVDDAMRMELLEDSVFFDSRRNAETIDRFLTACSPGDTIVFVNLDGQTGEIVYETHEVEGANITITYSSILGEDNIDGMGCHLYDSFLNFGLLQYDILSLGAAGNNDGTYLINVIEDLRITIFGNFPDDGDYNNVEISYADRASTFASLGFSEGDLIIIGDGTNEGIYNIIDFFGSGNVCSVSEDVVSQLPTEYDFYNTPASIGDYGDSIIVKDSANDGVYGIVATANNMLELDIEITLTTEYTAAQIYKTSQLILTTISGVGLPEGIFYAGDILHFIDANISAKIISTTPTTITHEPIGYVVSPGDQLYIETNKLFIPDDVGGVKNIYIEEENGEKYESKQLLQHQEIEVQDYERLRNDACSIVGRIIYFPNRIKYESKITLLVRKLYSEYQGVFNDELSIDIPSIYNYPMVLYCVKELCILPKYKEKYGYLYEKIELDYRQAIEKTKSINKNSTKYRFGDTF